MPGSVVPSSRRIAGFDGLRGLAVLLVFTDHRLPGADAHFLGGFAVHIFFVLSGFLIIGMLHRDQIAIAQCRLSARQAWRTFMIRRAARIFPIYYLILAIMLFISLSGIGSHRDVLDLAFSGLFLTNEYIVASGHWGAFNQAWTLAIEEQFYLLAAPLLILALRPRATWAVCAATALIGAAWNVWLCFAFPKSMALGLDSLSNFTYIAIGGMFALRRCPSSVRLSSWIQPISLAGLLLIPFIPDGASNPAIRMGIQPALAGLLLVEMRDHGGTWLVRLLENRGLIYLGRISYCLYLVHQFLSADLLYLWTAGLVNIKSWTPVEQFLPLLLFSVCVASCSWRWLEQPVILAAKRATARADKDGQQSGAVTTFATAGKPDVPQSRTRALRFTVPAEPGTAQDYANLL